MTTQTDTSPDLTHEPAAVAPTVPAAQPASVEVTPPSAPPAEAAPAASAPSVAKEPTLTDVLARPEVQAEIAKASKLAAKRALDEAKAEAERAAERAKLDEVARLKLEAQEAAEKAKRAEQQASEAIMERDLANVLITSGHRLHDSKALEFLRYQAFRAVAHDEGLSMETAVKQVLAESPWLMAAVAPTPTVPTVAPPAPPAPRPSTAPTVRETTSPAATTPPQPIDTMRMTAAEYNEYKRRQHGLH